MGRVSRARDEYTSLADAFGSCKAEIDFFSQYSGATEFFEWAGVEE